MTAVLRRERRVYCSNPKIGVNEFMMVSSLFEWMAIVDVI